MSTATPLSKKSAYKDQLFIIKVAPIPKEAPGRKTKRKKTQDQRNADTLYAEHLLYRSYLHGHQMIPQLPDAAYGEDQVSSLR